jgi:hypothetical protein
MPILNLSYVEVQDVLPAVSTALHPCARAQLQLCQLIEVPSLILATRTQL